MGVVEADSGWYERMAQRAAQRAVGTTDPAADGLPDRETWPVPPELRGYSARDCFLWYVRDGWLKIFGGGEPVEAVVDNDFGYHVLRKGEWQLTFERVVPE